MHFAPGDMKSEKRRQTEKWQKGCHFIEKRGITSKKGITYTLEPRLFHPISAPGLLLPPYRACAELAPPPLPLPADPHRRAGAGAHVGRRPSLGRRRGRGGRGHSGG